MGYSHGSHWTEDRIRFELEKAAAEAGRMPSANELYRAGRGDLANAVARSGGFAEWARRAGLDLKGTETHRGQAWERHEEEWFRSRGASVESMTTKAPFDLLVNGFRVDVKSAAFHAYDRGVRGFVFSGLRRGADCDFFDLVCVAGPVVAARFIVPAASAAVQTVTITARTLAGTGTYSAFRDRVDLLAVTG